METDTDTPNLDSTPPPGFQGGVWPPPPVSATSADDIPELTVPFRTNFLRTEGSVPDLRTGTISFSKSSILIAAKATLRYEIRTPIMLVLWLLFPLNLIAYCIVEYGIRRDAIVHLPWERVRRIVLRTRKKEACIVYDYPNAGGVIKTFSLGFKLGLLYDPFVEVVSRHIPDRVSEGKLRIWHSPPAVVFMIGFLCYFFLIFLSFGLASLSGTR